MGRRSNYDLPPQCSVCWCDAWAVPRDVLDLDAYVQHYGPLYCKYHFDHGTDLVCPECFTERIGPHDWKIHDHTHPTYWADNTVRDRRR